MEVKFNVVPLVCGAGKLPGFKVLDRRGAGGEDGGTAATGEETIKFETVEVVDESLDARNEEGVDLLLYVPATADGAGARKLEAKRDGISVLVLPYSTS